MRRLLIALLALSISAHAAKTTLTGNITDAQGNPLNGTLTMKLPVPAQDPATNSAIQPTPVFFNVVNGQISGGAQLYDLATIQPNKLWYQARGYDNANNLVFYGNYFVTGATFNLGAATPTTVTTSNISYFNPQQFTTTVNVATFSGADICAKINAAALANPESVLDARSFTGTQPCASNPFTGLTSDIYLLLGDGVTIQTTVPWVTQSPNDYVIYGSGRGSNGRGTTIQAVNGFPSICDGLAGNCAVIRLGNGTTAFGHRLENLSIDCNGIAGCIGMYSTDINEQSGMFHFQVLNSPTVGILVDGSSNAGSGPFWAQNYELFDGEVYALNVGTNSTIGMELIGGNNAAGGETAPRLVEHVTASGSSGHVIRAAFQMEQWWGGQLLGLNAEFATTGYQFGVLKPMNGTAGTNLRCAAVTTNCVWITSNSPFSNNITLTAIQNTPTIATNTIKDDQQSVNTLGTTDPTVGLYVLGNGYAAGGITNINTSSTTGSFQIPAFTMYNGADTPGTFFINTGKTAPQGQAIQFQDRGTNKFAIQNTSGNLFSIFDNVANISKLRFNPSTGQSFLNSNGTGAIFFNNDALSGTGGFTSCNGGATCNFTVGGNGTTTINAPVTVTNSINGSDFTLTCTMVAGVCNAALSHTYTAAPACVASWTGTGTLTGLLKISSSTTQATATSTVGTDTAQMHFMCSGT